MKMKTKNRKYTVKKLFLGHASIRDYVVKQCVVKERGIVLQYGKHKMTIPHTQLKDIFQFHKKKFKSKYSLGYYELVDFKFVPDNLNQSRLF